MSMKVAGRCKLCVQIFSCSSSLAFFALVTSPFLDIDTGRVRQSGLLIRDPPSGTLADIPLSRFVNVPIDTVNNRLTRESGEAKAEITNLEKKLQYHETTNQKSRENLEQILKSGRA